MPVKRPVIFTAISDSKPVSMDIHARLTGFLHLSFLCTIAKRIKVIKITSSISHIDILNTPKNKIDRQTTDGL